MPNKPEAEANGMYTVDKMHTERTLWRNARLCPMTGSDWDLVDDGAVLTQNGRILWLGAQCDMPDMPAAYRAASADATTTLTEFDCGGALLTPALIDCHTHLVYGENRALEMELRLAGASYAELAQAGAGIQSTVNATRRSSDTALQAQALARALCLRKGGVATIEVKSGYGLSLADEARMLRVARNLSGLSGMAVRTSYLAAHALPPEFAGRPDNYIEAVCAWLPQLHAEGLVDAVDAFCEHIAFSPAQVERVFQAAKALGLPVKLHAEQLSNQGGAAMAARYRALSCDHVEYVNEADVMAMAKAGVVATLLPGAFYFLREGTLPPIELFRRHGVAMAIASDHNPGTSPALSLALMMHMACTLFRLTPFEALQGVTVQAARALGLTDRGALRPGLRADFALWNVDHPRELCYWLGGNLCQATVMGGGYYPSECCP